MEAAVDPEEAFDRRALETPFRVTDLKQWVYCRRVLYYELCLPEVRPVTYKMKAGVEIGQGAERLETRREARGSLRAYRLDRGRREFNVEIASARLGLRGKVDMVIWLEEGSETFIPVDYKLSQIAGAHFKLQLAAYGLLLEEMTGHPAQRGFLYYIPTKRAEEVRFDKRLRGKLLAALDEMHRLLGEERMPPPAEAKSKCLSCEFRRFCNDV